MRLEGHLSRHYVGKDEWCDTLVFAGLSEDPSSESLTPQRSTADEG